MMLTEYFYPFDRGGSEWSVYHLAKQLIKKGHEVTVFTPNFGAGRRETREGINILRFPFYKKLFNQSEVVSPIYFSTFLFWFWVALVLFLEVRQNRPDTIHIQGKYFLPSAVILSKLLNIPTVITLRDYIVLCPYGFCISQKNHYSACNFIDLFKNDRPYFLQFYKTSSSFVPFRVGLNLISSLHGWLVAQWLRFFLRQVNVRIAISQKLASIYVLNHVTIDHVIYNTVEMNQSVIMPGKINAPIVFAGRCTPGKGVIELIEAYRQLKKSITVPDLMIIGDGPLVKKIKAISDPHIIYKGHMQYAATMTYMAQARLVVVPSQWEEPFGRVALEALSHGTPVVVTNKGGLPEIVENAVTGYVVNYSKDALRKGIQKALEQNIQLRINIRRGYHNLQMKFSVTPVLQHVSLYENLRKKYE